MPVAEGSVWRGEQLVPAEDACCALEAAGADVVGLNCHRGPSTMLPVIERVKKAVQVGVYASSSTDDLGG